jgi:DNA topoisomerase-1
MKLLIVESPGKVKKIQEFLGPEWKVAASVGHVRDMPVKKMGVAAPDFRPEYEATERGAGVLKRLAALAKTADAVYLATDPDREGEAIAWHLADALKLKNPKRVAYAEITRSAVTTALASPRSIDMALVRAQEARRVLDRFCGYMVSGPLSRVSGQKMSAGRVQSPATALIVERERAIQSFVSTTHYSVELSFESLDNITDGWKAQWLVKDWLPDNAEYLTDKAIAEKIAALRSLDVLDGKEEESRSAPPAPFTTSSLQQTANTALKFTARRTMELAQSLYEAGAITYMRTDSPNLSAEAITAIRAYASEKGLPLPESPRVWKAKGNAQEAHEAIRPTHMEIEDAGETEEHKALYRLIRLRALASQLADAVYAVVVLRLGADVDGKQAVFEAKGRKMLAPGWKALNIPEEETGDAAAMDNPAPLLKTGSKATALSGNVLTRNTAPPSRYTEASLVRELEKRGIGRPSTYAAIIETIKKREYVKLEKNRFVPTPLGVMLLDSLQGKFSFCEYDFTEKMEQALDDIAENRADYVSVLAPAYQTLADEVAAFEKATGKVCPSCGKAMVHRVGKGKGKGGKPYDFWGCSGCPECKQTL